MDKERLEEIEKRISNISTGMPTQVITWQGWKDVKTLFEDDYKYLVEQAERVPMLETSIKRLNSKSNRLEEQNKHYREIIQDILDHANDFKIPRLEQTHLKQSLEWVENGD